MKSNEGGESSGAGKEGESDRKTGGEEKVDGKSSSSSSSEGEEEGSVRHRKKAAAEGTDEGEGAPVTEDKGEEQHK